MLSVLVRQVGQQLSSYQTLAFSSVTTASVKSCKKKRTLNVYKTPSQHITVYYNETIKFEIVHDLASLLSTLHSVQC